MDIQKIRSDFPALQRQRNSMYPVYFDNACMAMKPKPVIDALNRYYLEFPACSGHGRSAHWFSKEVGHECEVARESIRKLINAGSCKEIIFTRNTTESLNLVARSFNFDQGDVVLTTDREHNSNLCPWRTLDASGRIIHEIVYSNADNTFNFDNLANRLQMGKVRLVSFVHSSNLDGYTIPANEIIEMCHHYGALVMLDSAQSMPHRVVDVQSLDVDFLAFSVHKMGGPTGIGVLYGKQHLLENLNCFMVGGDTVSDTFYDSDPVYLDLPERFEAGLQDYAGIMAAGAAAEYLMKVGLDQISQHEHKLNRFLTEKLWDFSEIEILGPHDPELRGGIVTFFVKKLGSGDIGERLDRVANIMVRTGTFCVHSWFNGRGINRQAVPLRVSFFLYNTLDECRVFLDTLEEILNERKHYPTLEIWPK